VKTFLLFLFLSRVYVFNVFFILPTFFFILFVFIFCLTHVETCKTEHSNSRLCIGLQLQAKKLLMITVKFR